MDEPIAAYTTEMMDEFCEHYNRELKALWDNGDHGTKYQAHNATETIDQLAKVEPRQERAFTDLDQLHDNQNSIVANMHDNASVAGPVHVVGASGESTMGTRDKAVIYLQKELKEMACLLKGLTTAK